MNEGIFTSFDGTHIFYVENLSGTAGKTPVTFIHGQSGGNHTMLKRQMERIAREYPVLAYDLRGGGNSDLKPRQEDYSLDTMARDALGLMAHKKIERTHIVGYSLGTTIALKVFEMNPRLVASLVLLHPTYNPLKTTGRLNRFIVRSGLNVVFEITVAGFFAMLNCLRRVESTYLDYTKLKISTGIGSYVNWDYIKTRTSKELLTRTRFAFARLKWDAEDVLEKVDAPVLCVAGGADSWTLPSAAVEIASRVKNGRCEIITGNLHSAVYAGDSGKINGHIMDFLQKVS